VIVSGMSNRKKLEGGVSYIRVSNEDKLQESGDV
jgi:hypothetical protein